MMVDTITKKLILKFSDDNDNSDSNSDSDNDNDNDIKKNINNNNKKPWIEKYRPQTLNDVTGHEHIISSLNNHVKKNFLPHMLFYGPPGTGKTSTILAVAKDLYGENVQYMILQLNASEERGIDVVRKRIKNFVMTKSLCFNVSKDMFKLVILDEIDAMTSDAQANLKKIVEMYTGNARFCLICNYIEKIDYALRSRCVIFRFTSLKKLDIIDKVNQIINNEKINMTNKEIQIIIRRANGDMRKILNQLQTLHMVYGSKKIDVDTVNEFFGYPTTDFIDNIINCLYNDSFSDAYDNINVIKKKCLISIGEICTEIFWQLYDKLLKGKSSNALINTTEVKRIEQIVYDLGKLEQCQNISTNENVQTATLIAIFKK